MQDWYNEVALDDIPEQYQDLAELIGIPAFVILTQQRGGTYMYLPKADALIRSIRDKRIRDEYNGYNLDHLAIKYGLSTIRVREIAQSSDKGRAIPGQVDMFEKPLSS